MVQDIILEIATEMICEFLAIIGFVLSFIIFIEFAAIHNLIYKFQIYTRSLFVITYFETAESWSITKQKIILINEIIAIVETLKNLDHHSQLFVIKAVNEYKAERIINFMFRTVNVVFSFRIRIITAISKYFTIDRKNDQLALIELFLDFFKPFKFMLYPSFSTVGSVLGKVTLKLARVCRIVLTFF